MRSRRESLAGNWLAVDDRSHEKFAWEAINRAGWEYLLPLRAGARWLCVDCTGGMSAALLAGVCADLVVVAMPEAVRATLRSHFERSGASCPRFASWDELRGERFDGFVLHDLDGRLERDAVDDALGKAQALLQPDGFVYVALRNRFGYDRIKEGWRQFVPGRERHFFRPAEFSRRWPAMRTVVHPMLTHRGRLYDVIAASGYQSAQNPSRAGERLRRALLGRRGAGLISPAFAVVATGPAAPPNSLDAMLRDLETRRGLPSHACRVDRYHCLDGGKVVVSASPPAGGEAFILLFARAPIAIARRRSEFELLARLRERLPDIASRIPKPEYERDVAGGRLFVMKKFDGVTLEAPTPGLDTATRDGAAFILRLHTATARRELLSPERLAALCGPMFDGARARCPSIASRFDELQRAVVGRLAGMELPVVWMHGDFKVENLVVDARTSRLNGVIDWEHSEPEGLPLLDLWYLLIYNRAIRSGIHFFPAVADLFAPGRLDPAEEALCSEYARELGIPAAAVPPLVGALIAHHCGRRIIYHPKDEAMMKRIASAVDACVSHIRPIAGDTRNA